MIKVKHLSRVSGIQAEAEGQAHLYAFHLSNFLINLENRKRLLVGHSALSPVQQWQSGDRNPAADD